MALEKNIQFVPVGFDTPAVLKNAYIRVDAISGNKTALCATIGVYNNKENKMVLAQSKVYQFTSSVDDKSKNFVAQAYDYLKTLPEFADAIDC
jgi:hypothetical protein